MASHTCIPVLVSHDRTASLNFPYRMHLYPYKGFSSQKFPDNKDITPIFLSVPIRFYVIVNIFFMLEAPAFVWNTLIKPLTAKTAFNPVHRNKGVLMNYLTLSCLLYMYHLMLFLSCRKWQWWRWKYSS